MSPPRVKQKQATENLFNEIEQREPGTSSWINVGGNKIGGYGYFQQGEPYAALRRRYRGVEWHFIGAYTGPLQLGDAGTLYLLAGWNQRREQWQWHCYWDCG